MKAERLRLREGLHHRSPRREPRTRRLPRAGSPRGGSRGPVIIKRQLRISPCASATTPYRRTDRQVGHAMGASMMLMCQPIRLPSYLTTTPPGCRSRRTTTKGRRRAPNPEPMGTSGRTACSARDRSSPESFAQALWSEPSSVEPLGSRWARRPAGWTAPGGPSLPSIPPCTASPRRAPWWILPRRPGRLGRPIYRHPICALGVARSAARPLPRRARASAHHGASLGRGRAARSSQALRRAGRNRGEARRPRSSPRR